MTAKNNSKDSVLSSIFAMCILFVFGIGIFFLITPKNKREFYYFIFIKANGTALCVTTVSWVLLLSLIFIVFKKKSRFITTAVEEGNKEFLQNDKLNPKQKLILLCPYIAMLVLFYALYAYFYYSEGGQWFYIDFLQEDKNASIRNFFDFSNGFLPYFLIVFYLFLLFNIFKVNYHIKNKYFKKDETKDEFSHKSLPEPENYLESTMPSFLLGARENNKSVELEPECKIPSFVYYKAPMTYGGLLIFGKKGSGKSSIIRRMIEDAIRYRSIDNSYKMSICVIDIKGDLADFIEKKAKEHGRTDDVIRLGVSTKAKWNPMGLLNKNSRAHECRQAGFFLRCAMTSGKTSSGNDSYWHDNADNLLFRAMHLLAMSDMTVSFKEINKLIVTLNDKETTYRNELYSIVEARFEEENYSEELPIVTEYYDTKSYFEDEFVLLDTKIRTTIVNVATIFLQKFMTREYEQSFGCSKNDEGHFSGFRNLIADGKIFVLDIRSNEHGTIAGPLGMLVKLFYQSAVKTRDRYERDAFVRSTLLVADEYQSFVTASSSDTEGDDKYLEMSRSFLAIDVFATQQYSSITSTVGKDMGQRIIGSFNNIITYKHNDEAITTYLDRLIGGEDKFEKSMNVSESSSSADFHYFSSNGNTEADHQVSKSVSISKKKKQKISPELFASLTNFEAVGIFDTPRGLQVTRFCTKPDFCNVTDSHESVLQALEDKFGLNQQEEKKFFRFTNFLRGNE